MDVEVLLESPWYWVWLLFVFILSLWIHKD